MTDPSKTDLPIVINWGMGADSSAILVRIIRDSEARSALGVAADFSNLVVLTAMVGSEYPDTKRLGEQYLLPLLREHGIRFVQVGRSSASTRRTPADPGYSVIEDSTTAETLHIDGGGFTLLEELLNAGTVPQYRANSRTCSQKYKGIPCDRWLEDTFGEAPFCQVFGFNADEQKRADKDDSYTGKGKLHRSTRYPLIEWGWGRADLERYLQDWAGEPWAKSCCTFCPFQGTVAGRSGVLARVCKFPGAASEAMFVERAALALNPRQSLFASKGGAEGFFAQAADDQTAGAFAQLEQRMASCEYALYRVRRVVYATKGGKGGSRNISVEAEGSHEDMAGRIRKLAGERGVKVEQDEKGALRVWIERRDEEALPAREELFVVAPKTAQAKIGRGFEAKWAESAPQESKAA